MNELLKVLLLFKQLSLSITNKDPAPAGNHLVDNRTESEAGHRWCGLISAMKKTNPQMIENSFTAQIQAELKT